MQSAIASAERITVLCSNGFKAVLQEVAPQFEKATKHEVAISYSGLGGVEAADSRAANASTSRS
jgi:ABC-type molybdate transport system substrate-binding protein